MFNRVLAERLLGGRCANQYGPRMFKGLVTAIGAGSTRICKNKI